MERPDPHFRTAGEQESWPRWLTILSGLPGCGKTTMAKALCARTGALHVRVDTIEQSLRDAGVQVVEEGYRVAYVVARDNLSLGHGVVADSVNPVEATRVAWRSAATRAGSRFIEILVVCSDPREHQLRVEARSSSIEGLRLPTWTQVQNRRFEPWDAPLVLDTAGRSPSESLDDLLAVFETNR